MEVIPCRVKPPLLLASAVRSTFLLLLFSLFATAVFGGTSQAVFRVDYRCPTSDKPQSKLWHAQGCWWAVLPTSAGPSLWKRGESGWAELPEMREALAGLPGRCDVWFDRDGAVAVGVEGDRIGVFGLWSVPGNAGSWKAERLASWTVPTVASLETATIARDAKGVWWIAAPVTPKGGAPVVAKDGGKAKVPREVWVWRSEDGRDWRLLQPLARGIGGDDICLIARCEGGVGVAWSDQNRDEVGFRFHSQEAVAESWSATEIVDSGSLTADDHLHAAFAGGRFWLATKNSVDAVGKAQLVMRVRSADGSWTNFPYEPKTAARTPSRPIVVPTPDGRRLVLFQTDYANGKTGRGDIAFGVAGVDDPVFSPVMAPLISPELQGKERINDVTGPKDAFPASGPWIVLASDTEGRVYEADVRPLVDIPYAEAKPRAVTEPARWDTDDPAFWIDERDPAKSLVVGTDKHRDGALVVYALDGRIVKRIEGLERPNNVDVVQNFSLGGRTVSLAVVTEREKRRLRVFTLPSFECVDNGDLIVFGGDPERAPMGVALYLRPRDGALFAIVSGKSGPSEHYLAQYRLEDDGTGRLKMSLAREFGRFSGRKEIESVAVDSALGYVYYSDETCGVRKYPADPEAPEANKELALFATAGFVSDHEGISIYRADERTGYIVVSDQQADRFWLFRREGEPGRPHEHIPVKVVKVAARESDGSEVTNRWLGPRFPAGAFVAMSNDRTFQLYSWEDFAGDDLRVVPAGRPPVLGKDSPGFFFTVASDPHFQAANYDKVLAAMQARSAGTGAFQVLVGDLCDKPGQSPQALRDKFDARFGASALLLTAVGNHDADVAEKSDAMSWRRLEFERGRDGRKSLRERGFRPGPKGCEDTTFSWDEGNAHFVVLNLYWNGRMEPGSDAAGDGDVVPALLSWLDQDLADSRKPFVFVFGHEPAFPLARHVGNSLDAHPANRDAFWSLLSRGGVQAYFCGHIHFYSKLTRLGVRQLCDGHAGRITGGDRVYLSVQVGASEAEVQVWKAVGEGWDEWTLWDTLRFPARRQ